MKGSVFLSAFLVAVLVLGLTGNAIKAEAVQVRKIVVFNPQFVNEAARDEIVQKLGCVKIKNLDLIGGMAVYLPSKAAEQALLARAEVLRVDDDIIVEALAKRAPAQPPETLTWGVNRIDADLAWGITTADPIKVAIVDTGIDVTHPDLQGNIKGGMSAVGYTKSYKDDNGHGTHVAGIVGAINNTIGVIGIASNVDLYAVKVLDRNGSGYLSDIIEGLDWSISNGIQVVNMSLGTSAYNASFEAAVKRVNAAGIVQVAAAGNSGPGGNTVNYPARFPEVIAVSAIDNTDTIAYFSSRGPEVDLTAPGVSIYSTYKGSTYATLSGTSMAAPHVTGTVALVLTRPVTGWDSNSNGRWDPAEVQNKLENTAEQVAPDATAGKDSLYGSGLVDALAAIQ